MTTTETTRAVVAAYVAALRRGDLAALRASFAPKATWTIRGDLPVAGTWTGADEILDGFLAQVVATLDPEVAVTQTLHRILADGEYAVAEWTSHAQARSGTPYDNDYAVLFQVRDGLIVSVREYCDTSYMKRVLFEQ
ncbi:nuclear transport factor 2 family protein [Frankia sp. AgB1.9]|uniref:nuclear transport factor 2 family protein n=1 Tax=unclassified Frankia TaxID=2632575 RepID=UPI0019332F6B|nr:MULTISPECIES: nuclear transport factor 2 family protein [unclassified Frankia]MBL7488283.1 nuclear transport factor 2 family protein [Frankia sp. AgW1.1]MBL7548563.1 nuclear transport factor 2 family protein [Frankia sp. AgB1.9]MBL7619541.1 nuclear transport factor 2 family protein [Frankia sp. AgB1.8]